MKEWEVREESGLRWALLIPSSPLNVTRAASMTIVHPFSHSAWSRLSFLLLAAFALGKALQVLPHDTLTFADWTCVTAMGSFAVGTVTLREAATSIRPFWISVTLGEIACLASPSS